MDIIWITLPFIPLVTHMLIIIFNCKKMCVVLSQNELDRDTHRSYILALSGFSFTALLAVVLLEATVVQGLHFVIYYLLLSFLFFLAALNIQGYKAKRWQDELATSFADIATLSLILSIIFVLFSPNFKNNFDIRFSVSITILASLIWALDHFYRIYLQFSYYKDLRE